MANRSRWHAVRRGALPLPPPPPDHYSLDRVERYVDRAASRDVTEITFTEHLYRCVESDDALAQLKAKMAVEKEQKLLAAGAAAGDPDAPKKLGK